MQVKRYEFKQVKEEKQKTKEDKIKLSKDSIIKIAVAVIIILVITVIVFLVNKKENVVDEEISIKTSVVKKTDEVIPENTQDVTDKTEKKPPAYLNKYLKQNEYTVGYIKIEDTQIDYPVVQSDNNDYYMIHNFNFYEDKAGAIFMDYRCDIDDFSKTRNIILYGHRMKDGSMFKGLLNYEDKDFFLEHRTIKFDTINEALEWEVFAVFKATTDFYYIDTEFPYDEMWLYFLEQCKEKSMHKSYVNFYKDDIVLTLSTCTTKDDERFVVMAKLLR